MEESAKVYDFFSYREKILGKKERPVLVEKPKPNETPEERNARIRRMKLKFMDICNNGYNPEIHGPLFEE